MSKPKEAIFCDYLTAVPIFSPSQVSSSEPAVCRKILASAEAGRFDWSRVTVSSENPESVVRLPKKPVISSSFHCGWLTVSAKIPIRKAPIQLANRFPVDVGIFAGTAMLSSQRYVAPNSATMERGRMWGNILCVSMPSERLLPDAAVGL